MKTDEPLTEGFVSLLEPFVDSVVICHATALVVITTMYFEPGFAGGLGGIETTSAAFERNLRAKNPPEAAGHEGATEDKGARVFRTRRHIGGYPKRHIKPA